MRSRTARRSPLDWSSMGDDHEETVVSPSLDDADRHTLLAERRALCSSSSSPLSLLLCADDEKLAPPLPLPAVRVPAQALLPLPLIKPKRPLWRARQLKPVEDRLPSSMTPTLRGTCIEAMLIPACPCHTTKCVTCLFLYRPVSPRRRARRVSKIGEVLAASFSAGGGHGISP